MLSVFYVLKLKYKQNFKRSVKQINFSTEYVHTLVISVLIVIIPLSPEGLFKTRPSRGGEKEAFLWGNLIRDAQYASKEAEFHPKNFQNLKLTVR